jgi:hypothetical protein
MASIETNMAFVKELLSSEKITVTQNNEILDLLAKEISVFSQEKSKIEKNQLVSRKKTTTILSHDPLSVRNILKYFGDPKKLKYTTHDWDYVNNENKISMDPDLFYRDLKEIYYNDIKQTLEDLDLTDLNYLISHFLLTDYSIREQTEDVKGIHPFSIIGWGSEWIKKCLTLKKKDTKLGLKIGWSNAGLKSYLHEAGTRAENYEIPILNRPVNWGKSFWDSYNEMPEGDKPNPQESDFDGENRPNKKFKAGVWQFVYFSDAINLFKKCIEFRDTDFEQILRYFFSTDHDNRFENWEIIPFYSGEPECFLIAPFYVHTEKVMVALNSIVANILDRKSASRKVRIDLELDKTDKFYILKIIHLNSFTNISSQDEMFTKGIKSGEANFISLLRENLRSVCDLSIISQFNNNGNKEFRELIYLDGENNGQPKEEEIILLDKPIENAEGFAIQMKFYR